MQYLWVLWYAGCDLELGGMLADAVSNTLSAESPNYHPGLGWGVYSVLRGCVRPNMRFLSRTMMYEMIVGMTYAVTFFDQWKARKNLEELLQSGSQVTLFIVTKLYVALNAWALTRKIPVTGVILLAIEEYLEKRDLLP